MPSLASLRNKKVQQRVETIFRFRKQCVCSMHFFLFQNIRDRSIDAKGLSVFEKHSHSLNYRS